MKELKQAFSSNLITYDETEVVDENRVEMTNQTFSSIMTNYVIEVVDQSTVEMVKETNHQLTHACNCFLCSLGVLSVFLGLLLSIFKIHF